MDVFPRDSIVGVILIFMFYSPYYSLPNEKIPNHLIELCSRLLKNVIFILFNFNPYVAFTKFLIVSILIEFIFYFVEVKIK